MSTTSPTERRINGDASSGYDCFTITASSGSTGNFPNTVVGIYVGGAGNVEVITRSNAAVIFNNVPAGTILPVRAIRVNSTNTTSTSMVGIY
jgi:hypothetical protein